MFITFIFMLNLVSKELDIYERFVHMNKGIYVNIACNFHISVLRVNDSIGFYWEVWASSSLWLEAVSREKDF